MLTEQQIEYQNLIERINHYIALLHNESDKAEAILAKRRYPRKQTMWSPFYQDIYELSLELNRFKEVRHRLEDILAK